MHRKILWGRSFNSWKSLKLHLKSKHEETSNNQTNQNSEPQSSDPIIADPQGVDLAESVSNDGNAPKVDGSAIAQMMKEQFEAFVYRL